MMPMPNSQYQTRLTMFPAEPGILRPDQPIGKHLAVIHGPGDRSTTGSRPERPHWQAVRRPLGRCVQEIDEDDFLFPFGRSLALDPLKEGRHLRQTLLGGQFSTRAPMKVSATAAAMVSGCLSRTAR